MKTKIGLVTVLYNSNSVIENFFKSLSIQTFNEYILYIIDNSPNINCDLILQKMYDQYPNIKVNYLKSDENYGVAKGNNIGIKAALKDEVEFVLLLNNDIEFDDINILKKMYDTAIIRDENIIVPKIFYINTNLIWMAGGTFDRFRLINHHIGDNRQDSEIYSKSKYIEYAPTCFMMIKSEVFYKVGLMDENYFVYYDDSDFILRSNKSGYKIYYYPENAIYHNVSTSTGGEKSTFTIYIANRNRIYFMRKYYGIVNISIFYLIFNFVYKLLIYDKAQRGALISGIVDGLKMKIR